MCLDVSVVSSVWQWLTCAVFFARGAFTVKGLAIGKKVHNKE